MKTFVRSNNDLLVIVITNLVYIVCLCAISFLALEIFCRAVLGLGDPPILILDNKIEFMMRPSSSYKRWGNNIQYNAFGMRSPEIAVSKQPGVTRIMLMGDSVLNGGPAIDQQKTIPYMLSNIAPTVSGLKAEYLSVSCGGWGAKNMVEYIRKFGIFDADRIVILLNSTDAVDVASYLKDYGPDFPLNKPISAAAEGFVRYVPRFLPFDVWWTQDRRLRTVLSREALMSQARIDLFDLISVLREKKVQIDIVIHYPLVESVTDMENIKYLKDTLKQINADFIDLPIRGHVEEFELKSMYFDNLHLNQNGHKFISYGIQKILEAAK